MNKNTFIQELYESVPEQNRADFIKEVAESAARYKAEPALTQSQLEEISRRADDPTPVYVSAEHLSEKYGVTFPS